MDVQVHIYSVTKELMTPNNYVEDKYIPAKIQNMKLGFIVVDNATVDSGVKQGRLLSFLLFILDWVMRKENCWSRIRKALISIPNGTYMESSLASEASWQRMEEQISASKNTFRKHVKPLSRSTAYGTLHS